MYPEQTNLSLEQPEAEKSSDRRRRNLANVSVQTHVCNGFQEACIHLCLHTYVVSSVFISKIQVHMLLEFNEVTTPFNSTELMHAFM
jgi:hypothetical protein